MIRRHRIKPEESLEELAVMQDATPKNLEGPFKDPEWKAKMLRKIILAPWITQRGRRSQKTFAAKEMVDFDDIYLERMKNRKDFSPWMKENKPRK
jgi:hypothetical protein